MNSPSSSNAWLDSRGHDSIVPDMKRLLRWLALTALVLSATSCGIPGLLGRTASNTMTQVKQVASAAADAAY